MASASINLQTFTVLSIETHGKAFETYLWNTNLENQKIVNVKKKSDLSKLAYFKGKTQMEFPQDDFSGKIKVLKDKGK